MDLKLLRGFNQLKKAVFLDRDGVLNRTFFRDGKERAPQTLEQFEFLPGTLEALQKLKCLDYFTVVVTNQPDVARGWQKKEVVIAMNQKVLSELPIDDLKVCFHDQKDQCLCRKPNPGMLIEAATQWNIDIAGSFMVGDRLSDIEAGHRAGCQSILIGPGDDFKTAHPPNYRAQSLLQAVEWIEKNGPLFTIPRQKFSP